MWLLPDVPIALSAVIYAFACRAPAYCDWCVFIFLVPLYWYGATHQKGSVLLYALQGFWWGVIFFTLHMQAIAFMLMQHVSTVQACVAMALIISYCAVITTCWFTLSAWLSHRCGSLAMCLGTWAVTTVCYLEFVERCLFRIFFLPRGYVFSYPLVPLAQHATWLTSVSLLPPWILIMSICFSSSALVYFLRTKKMVIGGMVIILLTPFWIGWLYQGDLKTYPYGDFFVYAQPPACDENNMTPLDKAQQINAQLLRALEQWPQAMCICFPESTYPFALDEHHDMRTLWATHALSYGAPELIVITGGHRSHENGKKRTNALFCLHECRIIHFYDKSLYFPFCEYTPWPWNKSRFLSEFLLKNNLEFHQVDFSHTDHLFTSIILAPDIVVSPYICSDLFFGYARENEGKNPILWLVNDSLFKMAYFRYLMLLYAKLQACIYQRAIFYIGHSYGVWISHEGAHHFLPSSMIPNE